MTENSNTLHHRIKMTTILFDFCKGYCKLMTMIVPKTNNENNDQYKKLFFTIQYTKEELDKITLDFVTQMNVYIDKVNNQILKTFEEIEKEEEIV